MLAAAMAVVTLGGTTLAFRGRIMEEYWLWRLERGDGTEKMEAVEKLS